jgi:hypothetical protein
VDNSAKTVDNWAYPVDKAAFLTILSTSPILLSGSYGEKTSVVVDNFTAAVENG